MTEEQRYTRKKKIEEKIQSKSLRTIYWGRDFIKAFGSERGEYYRKKYKHGLSLPKNLSVQAENGITIDECGRVSVMVVDNPNMKTISINDALDRVEDIIARGYT